ncbi:hypothetical protein GMSM_28810 [Geomonas sp. Red276]
MAHRKSTWLRPLSFFAKQFLAVVYVAGNHFFYNNDFFSRVSELKSMVPDNVHFLEDQFVEIGGVVFVGATLWTDFGGKDPLKMKNAKENMNDFEIVKKPTGDRLSPEDTVDAFFQSKAYIFDVLKQASGKKSVVLTHHGISPLSISAEFKGDGLNSAFVTDLSSEIRDHGPELWVHGHTHDSFDYIIGKTRVIVNPRGYIDQLNPLYLKNLVIKL